jgi:hypothetical protein
MSSTTFPDIDQEPERRATTRSTDGRGPGVGVVAAMRRYWYVVAFCVLLCAGPALAYSLARHPTYSATAKLSATRLDVTNVNALPGAITAAQSLATVYSRAIDSDTVTRSLAARLNTTPSYIADHLSATPVPESPLVSVTGTSKSRNEAISLANLGVDGVVGYAKTLSVPLHLTANLLTKFRAASLNLSAATQKRQAAARRYAAVPTDANRRSLNNATAQVARAQLRQDTLRTAYQDAKQSQTAASVAQPFRRAAGASSDRKSFVQAAVVAGALIGLLIGAAVSTMLAARAARRAGAPLAE